MSSSLEEKLEERTAEVFRLKAQLRQEIEAHQRVQKALSESNNLLRTVIEASPEPIFVKDLQGRYQLINASVSRLLQKPISEIIGQDDTALFPPEVAAKMAADDRRIIASGQSETFEETAIATQERRTYLTTKTLYRDPQGNPSGIVGFAREIASLKYAHEALCLASEELELRVDQRTAALQATNEQLVKEIAERQQMNAEFEAIFKAIPDAIVFASPNRNRQIRRLNPAFTKLFGYSPEEVLGQLTAALYASQEEYEHQSRVRFNLRAEEKLKPYEMNYRRQNGEVFVGETVGTVVKDATGKTLGYVKIIRDVSERKRAEAALRESQEQYALAVRGSGDGLWDWNIITDEVYYSPRFKHILGYEEQEVADHFNFWESRLHPDDHAPTLEAVRVHLEHQVPYDVEYRLRTKTGEYRWIRDRGQAIWGEAGNLTRMAGSISDITPLKQAQEALRQANAELELRVQERTAELARSNQELELFAYVASHDLQEPLRKISSFTKLLAEDYQGHLDAEADEYIAYIIDGAVRMQNQIDDLLAYSRVSRDELRKEPTELGAVVAQVLEDLSVTIEENNAAIAASSLPTVQANPREMAQLLQNLISNGIKFRGEAPPRIHIEAQLQPDQWLVSVRDNGIGINPKFAGRIFEIFQRLHSRAEYAGTGIGLAICRKIVERHGGRIWVESELGQGATFYFTIPWE